MIPAARRQSENRPGRSLGGACWGGPGKTMPTAFKKIVSRKPGASVQTHLLTAALMWSFIGAYLIVRGLALYDTGGFVPLVAALLAGWLKSRYLLDKAAGNNARRISGFRNGTCIGGVYSWRMWGMVVMMMLAGRLLRGSEVPGRLVGLLYVAVGWGLFLSSRLLWQRWRP